MYVYVYILKLYPIKLINVSTTLHSYLCDYMLRTVKIYSLSKCQAHVYYRIIYYTLDLQIYSSCLTETWHTFLNFHSFLSPLCPGSCCCTPCFCELDIFRQHTEVRPVVFSFCAWLISQHYFLQVHPCHWKWKSLLYTYLIRMNSPPTMHVHCSFCVSCLWMDMGWLHGLAIMNSTAIGTGVQIVLKILISFLLEIHPGVGFLVTE